MKSARQIYERRVKLYSKLLHRNERTERLISNVRLIVFIMGIFAGVLMYVTRSITLYTAVLTALAVMFVCLIVRHDKLLDRIKHINLLCDVNVHSLKRVSGEWSTFTDAGEDFKNSNHSYTGDLDIFGKGSLFQWINTAHTFVGRQILCKLLSRDIESSNEVLERQKAVNELAKMLNWRQRLSAEGMAAAESLHDPEELINWAKVNNGLFRRKWTIAICRTCPIITCILILMGFVLKLIPLYWPAAALLIQAAMVFYNAKERHRMFSVFERYNEDLRVYYKMMRLFESQHFKSEFINKIKGGIRSKDGYKAFKQIDRLSSIVDSISYRRNVFYIILNIIALWDFQNIIALELWKQKSGDCLKGWFDALGKIEALSSLAVIRFDNPDWVTPAVCDRAEAVLEAKELGHPLLIENRVYNDLAVNDKSKVLLITGSNMSGKSTLLRTAGINLVLAYAGSPVCAKHFLASTMSIYTCMRVSDNLGESISSFYAELLRIKEIVNETQSGKSVFFLLDEIFKGTNSIDRHTGAKVLINKLSHTNSIGLVSTHDLELCDLEQKNEKIANYHFQEYYEEDRIKFDYKLRMGPSTTRNALYLMKLAGIDVD